MSPSLSTLDFLFHSQRLWIHWGDQWSWERGHCHPTPLLEVPLLFSFLFLAPSAPVINPQVPNSATGSSVRVCWSLYSDDTVESYQLSYRPVQDSSPGKDQAGEALPGTCPCSWEQFRPLRGLGPVFLAVGMVETGWVYTCKGLDAGR